jgi:lysophospholipase L1-like esterase
MHKIKAFFPLQRIGLLLVLCILGQSVKSQDLSLKWIDPLDAGFPLIDGRGWQDGMANPYDRLPGSAENQVRSPLWMLSRNTAGLYISFRTDAASIQVRYGVKGEKAMPHMPATGVSGLDLYARDASGQWHWARGTWKFSDTVAYAWGGLSTAGKDTEYRLYLPLYNTVNWMQFGLNDSKSFQFMPVGVDRPIVAYGTSIMQGGCASRPGLAWTSILGRMQSNRIINLGFSGNGQMEKPLIEAMSKIDASLYILDCMPNLVDRSKFPAEEVERRTRDAIRMLQEAHPGTPILLAEHCCGLTGTNLDAGLVKRYDDCSHVVSDIHARMVKEGVKGLYLLTAKEIGFDQECTVDGTHPNDIGMMRYAEAYARKIRRILK